jgi:chemotaxis protein methyltransferase CheR
VGAEVYSLAMLASEYNMLNQCTFLAADIDQTIINKAQAGFYTDNKMLVHVKPELKNKYMPTVTQGGKEGFQIIPALRNAVRFRKMDLLKDNYDGMQDLILCRNVVIYFTAEAQKMLYEKFYNALAKDGILVVGGTERVPPRTRPPVPRAKALHLPTDRLSRLSVGIIVKTRMAN